MDKKIKKEPKKEIEIKIPPEHGEDEGTFRWEQD